MQNKDENSPMALMLTLHMEVYRLLFNKLFFGIGMSVTLLLSDVGLQVPECPPR
jgi:hypothetical protein